ncbi:MAG: nucleoside hydrolase, partial [Spirochaetales bacterium]|nr:nucleoside hydrolase [Spirochaetales bacterium]MCF7937681.1 nucleoside hydrolase [Spirochaetales bacterium]
MSSAAGDPQNKGRRIPVLMDCDPGHDDMMAIILASMSDRIELLGVTTVAGNQTGTKTFQNARRVLKLIGAEDVPVVRGFDRPLFRELVTAPQFHGVSGLDGADLPEIEEPAARGTQPHAVEFLARTIREHSEAVTLVPTGPLTNIGALLRQYPELTSKIKRIVLMGGAFRDSNIIPGAEYNIYVDPEAARAVFLSGVPVTMVGLDVTNKAQLTRG